jgi:hypothetical protein
MQAWMPYPELLMGLTGQIRSAELRTAEQQERETGRFIRQVLYTLRGEPTIVFTHAQNARHSWTWLQNSQLIPDKIQFGDGPVQELALHGKHLRLIRVRDDERNETGQWWAPDDDEHAGQAKGLWVPPGADEGNRIFSATSAKGGSHKKKLRDDTKLTPHINPRTGKPVINSGRNAWNPALLEIAITGCTPEDKPDAWAMYAQQQRIVDDYRDGLKFPLVLHLAGLATEYALPHEFKVLDDSTTPDESDDLD